MKVENKIIPNKEQIDGFLEDPDFGPISMVNLLIYKASNSNDYDRILNLNNLIIVIGVLSLFFFN